MALRIGPKAMDPMAGYQPAWTAGPGPVSPGGKGIPKWRALALLAGVLILTSNLPTGGPPAVQADQFTMPGGTCLTTDKALVSFDMTGYQAFSIAYKLVTTGGGPFVAAWRTGAAIGNSSWPAPLYFYGGASSDPDKTFFVYGDAPAPGTRVTLDGNRSGNVQYVIGKAAAYAGCYSVSQIVVTRWPSAFAGGSGESIDPSLTPAPTASTPAGYDCNGSSDPEDCDEPPDGWCWVEYAAPYGSVGHRLEQCDAEPAEPAGGPGSTLDGAPSPACDSMTEHYRLVGPWSHSTGGTATWRWLLDGGSMATANGSYFPSPGGVPGYVLHGPSDPVSCFYVHYSAYGGSGTNHAAYPAPPGGGATVTFGSGWVVRNDTNVKYFGPLAVSFNSSFTIEYVDVWSTDGAIVGGGGPPEPSYAPPSGFPNASGLPQGGGLGGGPVDQCEGPDDAELFLCGDGELDIDASFNVTVCPSGSNLALCQVAPSAFPDESGDIFTAYQPDPSGFGAQLAGKAPFGIVGQVQEALGGAIAAPAGPAVDLCGDIPVMGSNVEFCIPTEAFEAIGEWRWLMVIVVYIAVALGLLGVLLGSVGGKAATGSE